MADEPKPISPWQRVSELWRRVLERRMYAWLALYTGGAYAVFSGLDALVEVWPIPEGFAQAVHVFLLLGFPITLVLGWYHGERGEQRVTRGEAVLLAMICLFGTSVLYRLDLIPFIDAYRVDDPRHSYLVQAHQIASTSAEEEVLATDAAAALTHFLTGWREIRASPMASRAGFSFSLGLPGQARSSLDESFQLARLAGAGTLATVLVEVSGDMADVQVGLYDVRTEEPLDQQFLNRGPPDDAQGLVLPIAQEILGLAGAPPTVLLQRESQSVEAMSQTLEGRRQLERFELEAAEVSFRAALAIDSTLARAHRDLGTTLFWRGHRDPHRFSELEGQAARHGQAAVRFSSLLPYRDSLHAYAFSALADNRFGEARTRLEELLESDETDAYAWMMLGTTEFLDEAMGGPEPDGRPRRDWNRALRALFTTVDLSPELVLGYAFLFRIYSMMGGELAGCPMYLAHRRWGEGERATVEATAGDGVLFFCPVYTDSIEWWTHEEVLSSDRTELRSGDTFFALAIEELERWGRFSPMAPQPLDELSTWFLAGRDRTAGDRRAQRADSLGMEALRHARAAIDLAPDTTPERLIRLGSLELLNGNYAEAERLTDEGLRLFDQEYGPESPPPTEAANIYAARGRIARAIAVADRAFAAGQSMQDDPETGEILRFLADLDFTRLRFLGAYGLPELTTPYFERIEEIWDAERYSDRQRALLRRPAGVILTPALVFSDDWRNLWVADADSVRAYWEPYLVEPNQRAAALDRALAEYRVSPRLDARPAFAIGVMLASEGRHAEAIPLFSATRRFPFFVDYGSGGWALRVTVSLFEARSLDALGDPTAIERYQEVVTAWQGADAPLQPFVSEARDAISRLSGGR